MSLSPPTVCLNCNPPRVLVAEGRGWVHAESGTYRCPSRKTSGDGYAMPSSGPDLDRMLERHGAAEYDRGWENATDHYERSLNLRQERDKAFAAGAEEMKMKIAGLVASA